MTPTDALIPENSGLEKTRLKEIVTRLKVVQRKCAEDPVATGPRNQAKDALDAVLIYLKGCMVPGAEPLEVVDLDLRLATIEELFDATGSHSLGQVIGSIRATLSAAAEDTSLEEEPPPPRRFEPPPTAAVRRRRPRPASHQTNTPAKVETRRGRFGWLKLIVVIAAVVAAASAVYLRQIEPDATPSDPADDDVTHEPVASTSADSTEPRIASAQSAMEDEFESHEEEMATFTLEIHLAESTLEDGDVSGSLRHFAAAAAIDRHHRRLVSMGKSLIAALLREADLAYDSGDWDLAGKKVKDARNIARGLRIDDSTIDNTALKHASMTRFEDITPGDGEALRNAVGHPVRLILKTRDVIFGHLKGIQDDILLLDVYSGVKGGDVEFSTSILASTIRQLRVYDAKEPSEIMTGD